MVEESLEEKCFRLGFNLKDLPSEPEPLDREYYNLGLKVYHMKDELYSLHLFVINNLSGMHSRARSRQYAEELGDKDAVMDIKEWQTNFQQIIDSKKACLEEIYKDYQTIREQHLRMKSILEKTKIEEGYQDGKKLFKLLDK